VYTGTVTDASASTLVLAACCLMRVHRRLLFAGCCAVADPDGQLGVWAGGVHREHVASSCGLPPRAALDPSGGGCTRAVADAGSRCWSCVQLSASVRKTATAPASTLSLLLPKLGRRAPFGEGLS